MEHWAIFAREHWSFGTLVILRKADGRNSGGWREHRWTSTRLWHLWYTACVNLGFSCRNTTWHRSCCWHFCFRMVVLLHVPCLCVLNGTGSGFFLDAVGGSSEFEYSVGWCCWTELFEAVFSGVRAWYSGTLDQQAERFLYIQEQERDENRLINVVHAQCAQ